MKEKFCAAEVLGDNLSLNSVLGYTVFQQIAFADGVVCKRMH